ncbi:MAG TPA: hypothetical protein VEO20_03750 [Thermoplasmata archaeon]|nr:hypothetical protein [Thermoplasmata archaeon]
MPVPLDFLVFVVLFVLTLALLLANYVFYLRRGRKYHGTSAVLTFLVSGVAIGGLLGPAMLDLGTQYGTATILGRWGFTFGWTFLLTLAAACVALFERAPDSKVSVTLNVVATILLGFALAAGLIFTGGSLPPLPASILNLALAAILTAGLKWVFEKRRPKPKTRLQRFAEFLGFRRPEPKSAFQRFTDFFKSK